MITYYNPVTRMNYGGYLHRPSYGGMGGRFNAGIASVSGGSHPIFQGFGEQMAGFLTQSQTEENKEKVQPFVQEVETLAKTTFGDEAFQNAQVAGQNQTGNRFQRLGSQPMFENQQYRLAGGGKGSVGSGGSENKAVGVSKFARALGALRRPGAIGYAEGGKLTMEDISSKALQLFGEVSESSIMKTLQFLLGATTTTPGLSALTGESDSRSLGEKLQVAGSYTLPPYILKKMGYDRAASVLGYPFDDDGKLLPNYANDPFGDDGKLLPKYKDFDNPSFTKGLSSLGRTLQMKAEGGIVAEELNDKELIAEAVAAIKGESDNPKEVLGIFLLRFGEEQLRNLVESVQSGELDETQERFEKGDKGIVNGPGDGSGKDDMVPASMDGEQDVLLTAGEFVMKKDSTDAIERAFGGGFLDEINDAGKDAPNKLKQKVAVA